MSLSEHERALMETLRARLLQARAADEIALSPALTDGGEVELGAWLAELDRILGELLDERRKYYLFGQSFAAILDYLCALANLDFSTTLDLRGEYDEMDAVCMALNMLGEELRASTLTRDQVQAIFNAIPDSIIVFDPDGRIELANTATGAMLGCDPAAIIGRPACDVLSLARDEFDALLGEIRRQPVQDRELAYAAADGAGGIEVSLAGAVIGDSHGQVQSYVWIAKNITRRKELERELESARDEALESSRLKSEFLANMSHEIRTPMNGVMGMLELLLDTRLSRSQEEMARTAMGAASVLLGVLNDILDVSKIEAGKLEFESVGFDLQTVVDEAVQLLALRAQEKGLLLTGLVLSERPVALIGDPGRLRQVMLNLISNAIKFTDEGEIALRAHIEGSSEAEVRIRVEVRDTGVGISAENQQRIFGLFVQGDGSATRTRGGTGLGLTICRQIVHLMGGDIGVRSAPGAGSTFWFTVGLARGRADEGALGLAARSLDGARLLIVDEHDANRRILEYYVESWSARWESVATGRDALLALRRAARERDPFRLVILDMSVPDIDGATLARFIALDPEIPRPRMLLLTAVGHVGAHALVHAETDAQLTRPVRKQSLLEALARMLSPAAAQARPVPARRHQRRFDGARILVAEDNAVNATVALHQLTRLGCRVDVVHNGAEAVRAIDSKPYALVLMDCQMPQMDGYEATQRIRGRSDERARVPIVAMTASAFEGERDRCLEVGMDGHLAKPFTRDGLIAVLDQWVTGAEASRPPIPGRPGEDPDRGPHDSRRRR